MAFPDTDISALVEVYLGADLTADPNTWAPTDLSSRLIRRPVPIRTGRGPGQKTLQAGSCALWLQNTDGALTPLLATSTYYPHWDLGTPMRFSVLGVGVDPQYIRFCGFINDISAVIIPAADGENISAVRVVVSGITRRLSQGAAVKSALFRAATLGDLVDGLAAWWPLETGDERVTASSPSGLPGGVPMVARPADTGTHAFSGTVGGSATGPPGAAGAMDTSGGGMLVGQVQDTSAATTWRVAMGFMFSEPTGALEDGQVFRLTLSSGATIGVFSLPSAAQATETRLYKDPTLVTADSTTITDDGVWHHIQVDGTSSGAGADTVYEVFVDGVSVNSGTAAGVTYGRPQLIEISPTGEVDAVCHVMVWLGTLPSATAAYEAFAGHVGEQAHERFERVCAEEGITVATVTGTESMLMGAQSPSTVMDILRDAEKADNALLTELIDDFGLGFRCGSARINLTPASMTIDLSTYRTTSGTQADVLTPVRNDQRTRNELTVDREGGGRVTFVNEAHQNRFGRYDGGDSVNTQTDDLARDWAGWGVREGTFVGLRYASLPVDVGANTTALLQAWLDLRLGDRIDRTDAPAEHPTDDVRVEVEGYAETILPRGWSADLNVEPFDIWDVGLVAGASPDTDPFAGRLAGEVACALRVAIDSDDTSIVFDPNHERFTTDAGAFDPDLRIRLGGETVDVSSIATTAVTYVAAGAASHASNAAVTPVLYTGHAERDLICCLARFRSNTGGVLATPNEYTLIYQVGKLYLFGKVHDGSEADPVVTPSGGSLGETVSAFTFGLRGTSTTLDDLTDLIVTADFRSNASAQDIAYGSAYPHLQPGCIALVLAGKDDDWTSVAVPGGMVEIAEPSTTVGNDQGLYGAYAIQTTPALLTHGSLVVTGGASAISESMTLALAGGYQTMTVAARSLNGVVKSHTAGTLIEVEDDLILAL